MIATYFRGTGKNSFGVRSTDCDERCANCLGVFSDHHNGRCPCDTCGTIHDPGKCPDPEGNENCEIVPLSPKVF